MAVDAHTRRVVEAWQADWVKAAEDIFGVALDADQKAIVRSVQHNPRTVVKSGHARGKDYTAALVSLLFVYLKSPAKVISTAPTQRQVRDIMMSEAKRIWLRAKIPLGGDFLAESLRFPGEPERFLLGFKASDTAPEAWTGFHSQNLMVVVTEASGIEQETFDAIEGLLTGDSRLLLVLNPNRMAGESYKAFSNPRYTKFTLNCLDAPNVVARKVVIPGQVDYDWVDGLVHKPGWCLRIEEPHPPQDGDFQWDGCWYRAGDLFRVKVLGLWPQEGETQLIPLAWVEAAQERWRECGGRAPASETLRLGVDVAGMGADLSVLCHRYGRVVTRFDAFGRSDHMATAGRVKATLEAAGGKAAAYVDTIGEGAGVHSRLVEQGVASVSVKFSESAVGHKDLTGERTFRNLRAYCWWAIRDALDPKFYEQTGGGLILPPSDELAQDLTAPQWSVDSQGRVILESKDDIKARLGRSPDYGDALANTYHPWIPGPRVSAGAFAGVGVF